MHSLLCESVDRGERRVHSLSSSGGLTEVRDVCTPCHHQGVDRGERRVLEVKKLPVINVIVRSVDRGELGSVHKLLQRLQTLRPLPSGLALHFLLACIKRTFGARRPNVATKSRTQHPLHAGCWRTFGARRPNVATKSRTQHPLHAGCWRTFGHAAPTP